MIIHLTQKNFQDFGTILTEKPKDQRYANHHSISLSTDTTTIYQTAADTWLTGEKGNAVLSVSCDNVIYDDFYLDRPVQLRGGIWFCLTSLGGHASVELSAFSMPRLLSTRMGKKDFLVKPQLQVTTLYTFLYQEKEQGFLFPGESHSMYEMTYVDRDTLHCVADGQDLLLEQGELVLYDKSQWHMQYADIGVAPRFVTITFDTAQDNLSVLAGRKQKISQRAAALLQQMLREAEYPSQHSSDMILSLLQILLSE